MSCFASSMLAAMANWKNTTKQNRRKSHAPNADEWRRRKAEGTGAEKDEYSNLYKKLSVNHNNKDVRIEKQNELD